MLLYVSRRFVIQSYDDPVLSCSANKCAAYPGAPFAATHLTIASAIQIQACKYGAVQTGPLDPKFRQDCQISVGRPFSEVHLWR
jgi:hypothetical protein